VENVAEDLLSSGTFTSCRLVGSGYAFAMKTQDPPANRYQKLQASYLKQIAQIGPFVEGSLCAFKRAGRKSLSWHLTYKLKGKTRTVYVPVGMVEEVRRWTEQYRRLKQLIRKETQQSLVIIHRHVASLSAATAAGTIRRVFPGLAQRFSTLPNPRRQEMCRYSASHIWFSGVLMFLTCAGSRHAFDQHRNSGQAPQNMGAFCGQTAEDPVSRAKR
jgi:hypothetical protein